MRKFKIALDADDVLYECNAYALKLLNEKKGTSYRISEIEKWGKMGNELDERFDFFQDPLFYEEQPLMQGAKEFVKKLSQIAEVFIVTSVYPQFAGLRIQRLVDDFPWLEPSNILIASRKELVHVDMILDDGAHNVSASIADYPVLFRQPWNSHVTGMLSVNTYEEFITLLQTVMNSTAYNEPCDASPNDQPGLDGRGFPAFRARSSIICRYGRDLAPSPRRKKGHIRVSCRQVRVHRRHGQELLPFP